MLKLFRNTKFGIRIVATSILLIVATITVISCLFYHYASNDITKEYYLHSIRTTKQDAVFFDKGMKNLIKCFFDLKYDSQITRELYDFLVAEQTSYGIALTNIARILSEVERTEEFISSVYIYTPNGDFYDHNNFKRPDFSFKESSIYQYLNQPDSAGLYLGNSGPNEIFQSKATFIPLAMKYQIEGCSQWLYMVLFIDVAEMKNYLESIKTDTNNEMFMINESGNLLVSTDSKIAESIISDKEVLDEIISGREGGSQNKNGFILTYQPLEVVPWFIVNAQPEDTLLESTNNLKNYIIIISLAGIIVSIAASVLISKAIVRPLKIVENTIYKVTGGNFNVQCSYTCDNEVGTIGKSFNFMISQIKDLIERLNMTIKELETEKKKVEEEQELKRTAELKALQSQINPHFLYNTLSAVTWMAFDRGENDIYQITSSLGDFYRIALSKGKEIIPLNDEIRHVKNYLAIQKFMYGDRLQYSFEIDEDAMEFSIIKLVLQPLVENSIYHGIKKLNRPGEVRINISIVNNRKEIELIVYDNGAGIEEDVLDCINKKLESGEKVTSEGYGIFNVNERIKLFYGQQYGLRLESKPFTETKAIITLPAVYTDN